MTRSLRGVGVALITPFDKERNIDFDALKRIIEFNILEGVDYLVVLGTTGESATLTPQEKEAVLRFAIECNNKRLPIVYGLGGNNTAEVVEAIKTTNLNGVDALLSVSPYYNKPTQEGIYQHYKAIAQATELPIILYNVPGRTSSNITATTTLRLAHDFKNIIGIKEASGNLNQEAYILRNRPRDFFVISGDDNISLAFIAQGGDGVISVAAGAFPKVFSQMVHAALADDFVTARKCFMRLLEATDLLFEEGNPAGVKAALEAKGLINSYLRLPLVSASEALCNKLRENIVQYDI